MTFLTALSGALLVACAETTFPPVEDEIDIRRVESRVEVRRARDGFETLRLDVEAADLLVELVSWTPRFSVTIEAVAAGPGVPLTAVVTAEEAGGAVASIEIQNDLVFIDGAAHQLQDWEQRNGIVRLLAAGPIGPGLRELAPYRDAVVAHLVEARPAFVAVGLFQEWPDGEEPPWPPLDDPRDFAPPGHLTGDVVGLGMTCSTEIRCPSHAPYCVTPDHEAERGFCDRACAADADCQVPAGAGRCTLPVTDVPGVTGAVLMCRLECPEGACPGLLACEEQNASCYAPDSLAP